MDLDVATVRAITGLLSALSAGLLLFFWWTARPGTALVWWSLTLALAATAAFVAYTEAAGTNRIGLVIDDYLLILAHLTLWAGFRAFDGARPPLLPAAAALSGFTLALLTLPLTDRGFVDLAVLIAFAVLLAVIAECSRYLAELAAARLAVALLAVHAAFLVARLFVGSMAAMEPIAHVLELAVLLEPLVMALVLAIAVVSMTSEQAGQRLAAAARADPLTGVLNRRGMETWFTGRRSRATRFGDAGCAVILADLDHFKRINDTHGHAAGDEVLKAFTARARAELRGGDALVRIGGEEFVMIMEGADTAAASAAAERIRAALKRAPVAAADAAIPVTASFGVAAARTVRRYEDLDAVVQAADVAAYRAKEAGRDRVETAAGGSAFAA